MPVNPLESVIKQAQTLDLSGQLRLIEEIENLLGKTCDAVPSRPLVYGEFHGEGGHLSSEEDFLIAEWRPTESDLNGP
ncbi:MAG: hypothetical protein AUJ92_18370 [Armatimonadetes bacterium CG2_30_59_28]|nr:hypothetical protein [Armatimonadota bacterium]OIO90611.1 MAG: hypothetical protein AUJ92_18370 [Armatimonadetes bacterium CG2_30_59_28]PIU61149.1 MAG: hypothetical protein COS85_21725 [Armatimonadetes bacterium CG07_land_8_20_14_0_80_59_28]PIX43553.1 MAG: hypothetical protein COZ56_06920 [Armatimonadetes bacterium CG_4_8_14_3_um_filter_58_9]PIY48114.1 MAG: hypothetical protein COZ05_04035 [Armatimonadetes bacterium CG_4_10_14_3_um_filter_59_10]PJB63521.1 MAG: hypothetical protein CO095_163